MTNSILNTIKKQLGVPESQEVFDQDIIVLINSALSTLEQLGVGPVGGFAIDDETAEWGDLLGEDLRLNSVKTFVYLSVRLVFDPPATSFAIGAFEKRLEELTWRLQVAADPTPVIVVANPDVYIPGQF